MTDVNRIKKVRTRAQLIVCAWVFNALFPAQELRDCGKDPESSGLSVKLHDEAVLTHWKAVIKGPKGTPYEGGSFAVDIHLPDDYPFVPPKMKFETKVWHPNISSESGAICLDILKNEWSPALTVRTALISLQALMSAPEPDDPQDAVVADMYKKDKAQFEGTAKFWTETYATETSGDEQVKQLMEMGFDEDSCKKALAECGGDFQRAMDKLLG